MAYSRFKTFPLHGHGVVQVDGWSCIFPVIFNVGLVFSMFSVVAIGVLVLVVPIALLSGLWCWKQRKARSHSRFVDDSGTDTRKELPGIDEHRSSGVGMAMLALAVLSVGLGLRAWLVREDIIGTLILLTVALILIYGAYSAIRGFQSLISSRGILVHGFMRDLLYIPAGEI